MRSQSASASRPVPISGGFLQKALGLHRFLHLRTCRDAGLVAQATAEFLRAVEVADDRHPGALKVLAIMQNLEDRFWKRTLEDPSPGMIRA